MHLEQDKRGRLATQLLSLGRLKVGNLLCDETDGLCAGCTPRMSGVDLAVFNFGRCAKGSGTGIGGGVGN